MAGRGLAGELGVVLISAQEVLPLRFEGGSTIDLDPQGQLQVAPFEPERARVRLSRGRAHVAIRKRQARAWAVEAGPFQVKVTGTRFSLDWQPEEKRMEVVLHEGSVVVTGACLQHERRMVAHERFVAQCETAPAPTMPTIAGAPEAEPSVEPTLPAAMPRDPYAWRALVADGKYKAALQAAKREGIAR